MMQEEKQAQWRFPTDGLPLVASEYVERMARIYHCPEEFVAASVLATAATAVGRKVHLDDGRYVNYPILWFVSVARSGSNKSLPLRVVTKPLRDIDRDIFDRYKTERSQWMHTPAKDRGEEPRCACMVLDDCTDERRNEVLYLNDGPSGRGCIGIYPEIKGMFDSMGQYASGSGAGGAGISRLLRLWDGEDIKVDRRGGATMLVKSPVFNIVGDLQTGLLADTFGNRTFMTNGLNQRFLFCVADNIEYPPDRSTERMPEWLTHMWEEIVKMLYTGVCRNDDGSETPLFPDDDGRILMTEPAEKAYDEYYARLQNAKAACDDDYMASVYSKLQIQVLRLALTAHCIEVAQQCGKDVAPHGLMSKTMKFAIECMDYFEAMAIRVYNDLPRPKPSATHRRSPAEWTTCASLIRAVKEMNPGVSQAEIAALLGVSRQLVSKSLASR